MVRSTPSRRYFEIRDRISEGKLRVTFCRTKQNLADFFTKGLPTDTFIKFKKVVTGVLSLPS